MTTLTVLAVVALLVVIALVIMLAGAGRLMAAQPVRAEAHVFNSASDAREWRDQRSEGLGQ